MITDNTKILIINIIPNLKEQTGSHWRVSGHILPLGLFNIAAVYPNNTDIISIEIDKLSTLIEEKETKSYNFILIKFTSDKDKNKLSKLTMKLKNYSPNLTTCIVGNCATSIKNFDITCFGTGLVLLKDILNHIHIPKGFINTLEEDIKHMPIPISDFENINYLPAISNIEKSLSKRTIEINQPWQGFLDTIYISELLEVRQNWLNKIFLKLIDRGFSGFHINLKHWDFDLIDQINTFCMASNTEFSIYCKSHNLYKIMKFKGSKLKRIWLSYDKSIKDLILKINQANIEVGLELETTSNIDKQDIKIINCADRYCFKSQCIPNQRTLRLITYHFWSHKSRFVKRLFQMSTMSELIDFIKLSYTIIDILLINKEK